MALTGYGLRPGGWEKNLKRSTQGGYGAINRQPASDTLANMTREKYAAGLKAKQDKDRFDFAKQQEETRQGEWAKEFGLSQKELGSLDKYRQGQLGLGRDELEAMKDYRAKQLGLSRDELASLDKYRQGQLGLGEAELAALDKYRQGQLGLGRDELASLDRYRQGQLGLGRDEATSLEEYRRRQLGLSEEQQRFNQALQAIAPYLNLGMGESGQMQDLLDALMKNIPGSNANYQRLNSSPNTPQPREPIGLKSR